MRDVFFSLRFVPGLSLPDARHFLGRRVQSQRSFGPVENDGCAIGDLEHARLGAGDRGDFKGTGEDGDVRSCAAADRREADDRAAFHRRGVGRREILGDEDRTLRILWRHAGHAGEQFEHAAADVANIVGTLGEEFVAQRGESFRVKLGGILPGKRRALSLGHGRVRDLEEIGIVEQLGMRGKDRCLAWVGFRVELRAQGLRAGRALCRWRRQADVARASRRALPLDHDFRSPDLKDRADSKARRGGHA